MGEQSCDCPCSCKKVSHDTQLVVLTGGPGAGKTAVLEFVRKALCEHIAILPEAASILFGGGFWRLDSDAAKRAVQKAIYHVQDEMQNLVIQEKRWSLGLCDRGTLDGLAYWPGTESEFYSVLQTDKDNEFQKYKAVIHLRSPTLEMGYNYQNPIRTESAELSFKLEIIENSKCKKPSFFTLNLILSIFHSN
jgi:Cdc6-like AAA superfamily ATPase